MQQLEDEITSNNDFPMFITIVTHNRFLLDFAN